MYLKYVQRKAVLYHMAVGTIFFFCKISQFQVSEIAQSVILEPKFCESFLPHLISRLA